MNLRTIFWVAALLPWFDVFGAERRAAQPFAVPPPAEAPLPDAEQLTIEKLNEGDLEYTPGTKTATYTNGRFLVKYGPAVLIANNITLDNNTTEVAAWGDVVLLREGGQVWHGERLAYNFKSRVLKGDNFRTGQPPFFAVGDTFITDPTNHAYVTTNGYFTTDDHPNPNYRIRARKLVIIPGKSIEARHAVLYLGDVPVFYFPYYHKSLERHPLNYEVTPGFRSSWGPFLLNSFNWYWDQRLHGSLDLDLRGQRGIGAGPEIYFGAPSFGQMMVKYYGMDDQDPRSKFGLDKTPETRQRLLFTYEGTLRTNLTVKGVLAYQSDPLILRDFFESEYHGNVQPKTFLEVEQQWSNWNLNLLTQPQVNDYQETVERLPDLKLTGLRQQVGPTPVYYESESSVGYFRHLFPDVHTNKFYPVQTNAYAATRADTYHQFLLPWTFFGFLNVIPRVGDRVTYYSEAEGRGTITDEETRNIFNTGAEVTMKASRVYRNAENALLDVHGLRHIIEPSLNYAFVPDPDVRPHEIPQFDTQLPTSRLLPIDFPEYNSIDSIDSQQTIRFGLRNKLQTKREEGKDDLLDWALYADWHLTPHRHQTTFSDIYSDMDFRPRQWITFSSGTRYSVDEGQFRELDHLVTIQPSEHWAVQLGHLYREKSEELGIGNNLIRTTLYYRFSENWGARVSHYFEARDGVLEYQYYTVYRDFRSWTGALTLRFRENHTGSDDYTIAFTFSLKAAPRFGVGNDAVHPQRLIGG